MSEPTYSASSLSLWLNSAGFYVRQSIYLYTIFHNFLHSQEFLQKFFFVSHISLFSFLSTDPFLAKCAILPNFKNHKTFFFTLFSNFYSFPTFLLSKTSLHPIPFPLLFRLITSTISLCTFNSNTHPPSRTTYSPGFPPVSRASVFFSAL